jgi:rsbT co-antagonist protein RsbR
MATITAGRLLSLLSEHQGELLAAWTGELRSSGGSRSHIPDGELRAQCLEFLSRLAEGLRSSDGGDLLEKGWDGARSLLAEVSRSRALQGFSPAETATFVFSLKRPVFELLQRDLTDDPRALAAEIWSATLLLDRLGLYTTEVYQRTRDEIISRQQQELLELSTPVVSLWEGILAIPMIGTLDSARTQTVMEALLEKIVATGSQVAIIDITGVPTVDTLTAQHLLKTVTAARLMGAECIISGIRPQIAQTIVHLGVDLGAVTTKASLGDAFALALRRSGFQISRPSAP